MLTFKLYNEPINILTNRFATTEKSTDFPIAQIL